ncbi:MAG: efflux RND transporter periplasmic adaptor subunit [Pseudohongiellaceae bacterium]
MKKKIIILVLIAIGASGLTGILPISISLSPAEKLVLVEGISNRVISPSILASGFLAHEEEVMLSSEVIGKVAELFVEEGEPVSAGDLVLRVDDKNFLAGLEQSEAAVRINSIDIERQKVRVENLERQFQRSEALFGRDLIGEEEYESLRNQLDLARIDYLSSQERLAQSNAQLDQVLDNLSKTQIISPIDGVVTSLDIKVGETAIASSTNIPGSSLMTIANPSSIYTEVLVDEADIANIRVGQKAEIVAIAYPDEPMQGTVRFIANTAKIAQGRTGLSFVVKIDIEDPGEVTLRPGMSCRAEIFTQDDRLVTAVPIEAVLFEEDKAENRSDHFIFLNNQGIAKKTKVEVGLSDDEFQELLSEIDSDVDVIVGPNRELRNLVDGDRIGELVENDDPEQRGRGNSELETDMDLISLIDISKHYQMGGQTVKALDSVTVHIAKNDYLAFIGSSGSGKSTMLNILGCLDRPSTGTYHLNGKDVDSLTENELSEIRNLEIGFIFQSFNLLPRSTALANVMQPLVYRNISYKARKKLALEALQRVGLDSRVSHFPNQLSGGQRQRVAIARALVTEPSILLADEPTGNLDSRTTDEIMILFDELHHDGHTLIIVTHEPEIADHCKRVVELKDGRIFADSRH